MNNIYERWIDLKQKNEDYAASLRVVLPELDSLIAAHGLDKERQEKHNDLKQKFYAALQELSKTLQELCKQPLSLIRREQIESLLNTAHENYSALYGFSSEQEAATKQQYQTVLDLENYLTLLKQAYPNDILDNGDSLVSSLAIVAKIETQTDSSGRFSFLPQYGRQLALVSLKQLAQERGWPQQLYAAKSILDVLNGKLNPTTYIQSPWGNPVWQRINEELKSKFPDAWNTVEHQEFIREISSLQLWETKLVDLRQRLSWAKYADNPDNWRKFIVGEPSDNSLPGTEEEAQFDDSREDDNSGGSYEDQNGGNQSQPNPILAALQEAVEARIEIADKPYLGELATFYMVQALLSQRVINQFNQQLPHTIDNLRVAANNLKNTSAPQFAAIAKLLSNAYTQLNQIPKVTEETNTLSKRIKVGTAALDEVTNVLEAYKQAVTKVKKQSLRQDWEKIKNDVDNNTQQYAYILQARDSALGLLGASASASDLAQAAHIELASLYIALGLQAVRNLDRTHAQEYLNNSQKIIDGMPSTENQHLYSLLTKLNYGIEWLQECENGNLIEKLTEWRDSVYAEETEKAKQAWAQLEKLPNAKLSGWVVTELAERQMGLFRTIVIGHGDASTEEKVVFGLFLQLFDLIAPKDTGNDCFLFYGRQVKSNPSYSSEPDIFARFTLDGQKIFLKASKNELKNKAEMAEELKNYRLTYAQSEHLRTWLLWYKRHMETRQIIAIVKNDLISVEMQNLVQGQPKIKLEQVIAYIKSMESLEKNGTNLPLTRTTKNELQQWVEGIEAKFPDALIKTNNTQGEYKKALMGIQVWLKGLKDDNFPPLSAPTHSDAFITLVADDRSSPSPSDRTQSEMLSTQEPVPKSPLDGDKKHLPSTPSIFKRMRSSFKSMFTRGVSDE